MFAILRDITLSLQKVHCQNYIVQIANFFMDYRSVVHTKYPGHDHLINKAFVRTRKLRHLMNRLFNLQINLSCHSLLDLLPSQSQNPFMIKAFGVNKAFVRTRKLRHLMSRLFNLQIKLSCQSLLDLLPSQSKSQLTNVSLICPPKYGQHLQ